MGKSSGFTASHRQRLLILEVFQPLGLFLFVMHVGLGFGIPRFSK